MLQMAANWSNTKHTKDQGQTVHLSVVLAKKDRDEQTKLQPEKYIKKLIYRQKEKESHNMTQNILYYYEDDM